MCGQGDFLFALCSGRSPVATQKNEAGRFNIVQPQIQARPCLIVLAARPGNLPERAFSFSGTEVCQLPDDSWREWLRETSFQGLCFSFGDPQNKISARLDVYCRRTRLQIDCHPSGLKGSQDHIKLFHIAQCGFAICKKIPRKVYSEGGVRFYQELV